MNHFQKIENSVQELYNSRQIDLKMKNEFDGLLKRAKQKKPTTENDNFGIETRVQVGPASVVVNPVTVLKVGGMLALDSTPKVPPQPPRKPNTLSQSIASKPNTFIPADPIVPNSGISVLADLPPPPPRVFTKPKVPPGLPPPIESLKAPVNAGVSNASSIAPAPPSRKPLVPSKKVVIATQPFEAQEANDLSFNTGDRLLIISSSNV
jgi:hypothetical protein